MAVTAQLRPQVVHGDEKHVGTLGGTDRRKEHQPQKGDTAERDGS
jgi:hypothetical protein